jgi:hypothetical protein
MRDIFLGKPFHWALVVALVTGGWVLGESRLHVIWFNLFTIILLAATAAVLAAVILTSRPGERITRDPIEDGD